MVRTAFSIVLLVIVATASPAGAQPVLEPSACGFFVPEGEQASCYVLHTAADPLAPSLFLAILHSVAATPEPDPVLWLNGGPGQPAFEDDTAESWWEVTAGFRRQRDVIVYDARGAGRSQPSLDCDDIPLPLPPPVVATDPLHLEAQRLLACRDRILAQGIDLSDYRLNDHAADAVRIVRALGLNRVNLVGVSYGTRVAMQVLRAAPDLVRSAVLDGVYPPEVNGLVEAPTVRAGVFELLFDDCRIDWRCRAEFGDLAEHFDAMVERLVAGTASITRWSLEGAANMPLTPGDVIDAMIVMAGDPALLPRLPIAIRQGGTGDMREIAPFVARAAGSGGVLSEGVALSTECSSDWAYADFTAYARQVAAHVPYSSGHGVAIAWEVCPNWPVAAVSPELREPVISDVPVLMLTGSYDPVTPPAWAYAAARGFRNAQVVEVARASHGLLGSFSCATTAAVAFVEMPGIAAADLCRDRTRPPRFVTD
ncbi:MAG: alpha/beta fold hydrolase [Rhodospirillaceae bacterium]|nr:alpha/beta fold hydrolase [Rhodospirillaceae bacterium]